MSIEKKKRTTEAPEVDYDELNRSIRRSISIVLMLSTLFDPPLTMEQKGDLMELLLAELETVEGQLEPLIT